MEATWKAAQPVAQRHVGHKHYELTDHLGNVRVVVSDMKLSSLGVNNEPYGFAGEVVSRTDYYAFGSPMPKRSYSAAAYQFGFNGMLAVNELRGVGNHYTAEYWEMDARIGCRTLATPTKSPPPGLSRPQQAARI